MWGNYWPMMGNWSIMKYWGWDNYNYFNTGGSFIAGATFGIIILILAVWTLYWKYRAMWHAAKHDHKIWFFVLLVVNTVGILDILYIYFFSKYHKS